MAKFDYDIGILGGGAAGLTVAAGAAQFGAKAVLIEKTPRLGGDCLHFGCVLRPSSVRQRSGGGRGGIRPTGLILCRSTWARSWTRRGVIETIRRTTRRAFLVGSARGRRPARFVDAHG
jgi:glycine/D-amino acid oxidase-like deaminating enzyme